MILLTPIHTIKEKIKLDREEVTRMSDKIRHFRNLMRNFSDDKAL